MCTHPTSLVTNLMIKYEIDSLSILNHKCWPRRMGVFSKPDLGCLLPADVLSKGQYPRYCWRGACGTLLPLCHAAASSMHRNFLRIIAADSRKARCEEMGMISWMEREVQDEFERPWKLTFVLRLNCPSLDDGAQQTRGTVPE